MAEKEELVMKGETLAGMLLVGRFFRDSGQASTSIICAELTSDVDSRALKNACNLELFCPHEDGAWHGQSISYPLCLLAEDEGLDFHAGVECGRQASCTSCRRAKEHKAKLEEAFDLIAPSCFSRNLSLQTVTKTDFLKYSEIVGMPKRLYALSLLETRLIEETQSRARSLGLPGNFLISVVMLAKAPCFWAMETVSKTIAWRVCDMMREISDLEFAGDDMQFAQNIFCHKAVTQPIGEVLRNESHCVEQDKDLELTELRYDDLPTIYVDHIFQQGNGSLCELVKTFSASLLLRRRILFLSEDISRLKTVVCSALALISCPSLDMLDSGNGYGMIDCVFPFIHGNTLASIKSFAFFVSGTRPGGVETVTSWNNMAVCNIDEGRVLILDELKEERENNPNFLLKQRGKQEQVFISQLLQDLQDGFAKEASNSEMEEFTRQSFSAFTEAFIYCFRCTCHIVPEEGQGKENLYRIIRQMGKITQMLVLHEVWDRLSDVLKELGARGGKAHHSQPMSLREAIARIPDVIETMRVLAVSSHGAAAASSHGT
ncbi:hypothetical protein GUITHDRAFT_146704 [Guillardia theta CCMP2712]|uniref:Uncharacterized protein n=1 Tax=Guillardia theta (strain CCMP2712) TaxID=905079 RepID=L1IH01_GUITC|nr:hypothetical protein GUITHDRAFT_146704 [Guillardia theta CCMP2712]EKX35110.1 hypothetical protein GUITHDRAFT_146704 [Guillardia theta CCMP2712]|eukprot:XP_005822090.1 hypothetical protein GUITHDRAFT_146704 [Guillardia theta CCMP2712]